ncbi:hypothetical protein GUITHDRAFT_103492 [Guillardia theta CCMP2712]|uniref:Uncharacterized protein n=1 Tax=Guillardia theta (strain CCMP2712) TaxID=905079 RepID=L1JS52_GUITC|nr:hypothetical protein GUITHDRAFT_103492 [Guillardia theta CCMP2712]EKX50908.1 hypothetical protein GUITHDRAFT_103492 [Guillardia theta CCMP2712]|eukprot:XP_005837888.1 hypothetical protein GUITHDRAFT_103492 [Guillardia theta CCMP2712]
MREYAEHRRKGVPGRMPMSMIRRGGDREEMISLEAQIARVEEEIDQVNRQIREVEKQVLNRDMEEQLQKEEEQLRKEEEQLRKEEEQLRDLLIEVKRAQGSKNPQGFLSKPEGDMLLSFLNELCKVARAGKTYSAQEIVSFSTFLGGNEIFGNQLFLRDCYFEMKQLIAEYFRLDTEKPKNGQVILTGSPGIGKSCFAYFFLLQLLGSDEEVVYQVGAEYWYFDGAEWSRFRDVTVFAPFLITFRGWYICDLYEGQGNYVLEDSLRTIILAPPKLRGFKDILNNGAGRYFLPTWTDEEMSIFIKMQGGRVNEEEAKNVVEDWGNVPRNVIMRPLETLEQAIQTITSMSSLNKKMIAAGNEDLGSPSRLIHLVPSSDYTTISARACSQKAAEKIFARLVRKDWDALIRMVFICSDSGWDWGAGLVFECLAHEVLKKGGRYRLRSLGSGEDDEGAREVISLDVKKSQAYFEVSRTGLKEWKIMENTYCKPKALNFPCMSALLLSDQEVLYMFQMTRTEQYPIKLGPLREMLTALRAKNKFERVCLVFVLPAELERKASWRRAQVFTNDKTASEMEKQPVENVTQHAMFLSMEDVAWLKGAEKGFSS